MMFTSMLFRSLLVVSLAGLVVPLAGCGGDALGRIPVEGTVSFNGQPLTIGNITFRPTDKSLQSEALDVREGKFVGTLIPGAKQVEIRGYEMVTPKLPANSPEAGSTFKKQVLPAKFNDKSVLTADVSAATPLTFDL
ncbi:hypothetical protein [Aureliella helgolandensis]|uniref:Carboxypeptidase regulatory-like domain-containing protein n=1 Tax=Aureliella helgolandensis TaxID=2527968 RepID=A0A518G6U8_9BACT|nr:hypothetical protein [Aureliella helgolandensis]QDV24305.1 hypothetical protein Q31a_26210 [Aureliella helgolandensis]